MLWNLPITDKLRAYAGLEKSAEWAFEAARDALLHDKKIWVISNGVPFGPIFAGAGNKYPITNSIALLSRKTSPILPMAGT